MKQTIQQEALKKLLATCPHCAAKHDQLDTAVMNDSKDANLIHVRCRSCQGSVVALLLSTGSLISSIGLVTDLLPEDIGLFQKGPALTEDDLLAMHEWLGSKTAPSDIIHYRSSH